jgi:ketosteroid isomerase-like protein
MARDDSGLTDADRKAIADIRRELDAEFGALEDSVPLQVDDEPNVVDVEVAEEPARGPWSSRPGIVAAFVAGVLLGALAGGAGTLVWLGGAASPSASSPDRRAPDAGAAPSAADRPADDASTAPPNPASASVHQALDEWLDATRRGDISAQMRFYPSRVPVYYTWRDVPRAAVRAEKRKVFSGATRLEIAAGPPTVEVADDGATAVTRFRKRYVIEGPAINRKGEVLQELRWERTDAGWVIVSERDAQVLAAD